MSSVRDLLRHGARQLTGEDARHEAEILLLHVLGVSRAWLVAHADDAVGVDRVRTFRELVGRRAQGEPVAYLTGTRGFHALELRVTPDVLIPRPETELLVDLALSRIPVDAGLAVADLGTGSGAVALAIAKARPRVRVLATDASAAALDVARGNAVRLGLRNVGFAQGDWCAALGHAQFDVMVSNPPYVAQADRHLREGDLRFEPRPALVSGQDGLAAARTIIAGAREHLRARGWLLLEHGCGQAVMVRGLLAARDFSGVFTARDLEGRERVSGGRIPAP